MAATEGAGVATEGAGVEPDPLKWISVTLWAHKEAIVSSFLFCVTAVLYWLSLQIMTRQEQRGNASNVMLFFEKSIDC